MSACQEIRKWFTEEVRQPFEEFISQAEESCSEARRWVEREVRRPIERVRVGFERQCQQQSCNWWCLCCNKWFCWIAAIILRFIEWVVEIVGEWLVETVCKVIVKVIKIIVEIVITVLKFIVVGITCLVTDPEGALVALADFWYDIVDIANDASDLVGDLLGATSELLDITREFVLDIGEYFGPLGRFVAGIIAGTLDIGRRIVDGARQIFEGVTDIVTGILHLDFCSALEGLVNGVGFGIGRTVFGATGGLSLGWNGFRDGRDRHKLRSWLEGEIEDRFNANRQSEINEFLQMGSSSFGVRWPVVPIRRTISSRSTTVDLKALHENGVFNLYEVAGYAPFGCNRVPVNRSVYRLVYKNTDYRVSLGDLRAFLSDGADAAPEFEIIAGDKRVFKDMIQVAKRKMRQMAIELEPSRLGTFEIQSGELINGNDVNSDDLTLLGTSITTALNLSDFCDLPAVMVFGYDPTHFGLATLTDIRQPGLPIPPRVNTIATIRSSFMAHLFGTVLAHEMGHCFSIRHEGHDGMENIMFTLDPSEDLDPVTMGTVVEYVLMGGEPRFTLQDAKDAWVWILTEANGCLR